MGIQKKVPGVNIVGFLAAENGIGEAARAMVKCCDAADIPVGTSTLTRTPARQSIIPPAGDGKNHLVNVICIPSKAYECFTHGDPSVFLRAKRNIWYLFWELEIVPPILRWNAHLFDEIWTASRFTAEALRKSLDLTVRHVPIPLWQEPTSNRVSRGALGVPETAFVFLFTWDYFSAAARKNPIGVVRAFKAAFPVAQGAVLLLKSINAAGAPNQHQELHAECDGRPDIIVLDRYLSRDEMDALPSICDCYVSLHRSEGLGLTLAEAMRHAKPVISTDYGGSIDFVSSENGIPIPWRYAAVSGGLVRDYEGYDCEWAEPDEEAAALAMRQLFENPSLCQKLGQAAEMTLRNQHSLQAVAPAWREAYRNTNTNRGRIRSRILSNLFVRMGELNRRRKAGSAK